MGSKSGAPSFMVDVRGVFLDTFLLAEPGVLLLIPPPGVFEGVPALLEGVSPILVGVRHPFLTAGWKEGVTSEESPVLSAWILPNASSIMLSKSSEAGYVLFSLIEGDRSKLSDSWGGKTLTMG